MIILNDSNYGMVPWFSGRNVTLYRKYRKEKIPTLTADGYNCIDLGLPSGMLWADRNLNATSPEDKGELVRWGEPWHIDSKWRYAFGDFNSSDFMSAYNYTDLLTTLSLNDDAAFRSMGPSWRMPTAEEVNELLTYTNLQRTTVNGVSGIRFTGRNGNSIFIPNTNNTRVLVWTSSIYEPVRDNYSYYAHMLNDDYVSSYTRNSYCAIRGVIPSNASGIFTLDKSVLNGNDYLG